MLCREDWTQEKKMTIEPPGDGEPSAAFWESIRLPERARRHLDRLREARARGQWADELDDWSDLIGSLDRDQRKALIPVLSQACQ